MALRFHAWLGHKNIRYTVRYTVLSPTGSETSGTDRQSEIVAAINGPIAHFWCLRQKSSMISRARACAYVCKERAEAGPGELMPTGRARPEVGLCRFLVVKQPEPDPPLALSKPFTRFAVPACQAIYHGSALAHNFSPLRQSPRPNNSGNRARNSFAGKGPKARRS